jgi:hypothetical protein
MFGWETLKEAERYTRAADQVRLAESAMHLIEHEPTRSGESAKEQETKS